MGVQSDGCSCVGNSLNGHAISSYRILNLFAHTTKVSLLGKLAQDGGIPLKKYK